MWSIVPGSTNTRDPLACPREWLGVEPGPKTPLHTTGSGAGGGPNLRQNLPFGEPSSTSSLDLLNKHCIAFYNPEILGPGSSNTDAGMARLAHV